MFLPDSIYRLLPFAYIVAGLIVVSTMDSRVGTASGVLLVITGLIIWRMRVDYRHEIAGTKGRKMGTPAHGKRRANADALRTVRLP